MAAPTEVEIDSDRSTRNAKNTEQRKEKEGGRRRSGGVGAEANEHRVPQSNWILEGRAELKRPINLQCKKSSH